eukprot:scaffold201055_cov29-Tisochrysis_lutea.AAC.13
MHAQQAAYHQRKKGMLSVGGSDQSLPCGKRYKSEVSYRRSFLARARPMRPTSSMPLAFRRTRTKEGQLRRDRVCAPSPSRTRQ